MSLLFHASFNVEKFILSGRGNKHDKRKKFSNSQNGVILENNLNDPNSQIIFTILDFTKNQSFYALRYSYKPSEDEEMPLQIFDNINYESDIKNLIREQITRNKSYKKGKFECKNLGNGIFVVSFFKLINIFLMDKIFFRLKQFVSFQLDHQQNALQIFVVKLNLAKKYYQKFYWLMLHLIVGYNFHLLNLLILISIILPSIILLINFIHLKKLILILILLLMLYVFLLNSFLII